MSVLILYDVCVLCCLEMDQRVVLIDLWMHKSLPEFGCLSVIFASYIHVCLQLMCS